jgi:hypothetical protein
MAIPSRGQCRSQIAQYLRSTTNDRHDASLALAFYHEVCGRNTLIAKGGIESFTTDPKSCHGINAIQPCNNRIGISDTLSPSAQSLDTLCTFGNDQEHKSPDQLRMKNMMG